MRSLVEVKEGATSPGFVGAEKAGSERIQSSHDWLSVTPEANVSIFSAEWASTGISSLFHKFRSGGCCNCVECFSPTGDESESPIFSYAYCKIDFSITANTCDKEGPARRKVRWLVLTTVT